MALYKNKYRIESARLEGWDYSIPWWYYITINTKNHIKYFGEIIHGSMRLNEIGKIAGQYWQEIPKHFPNVELDQYIIMPNHIHGIIIINPDESTCKQPQSNNRRDAINCVSTNTKSGGITGTKNPQLHHDSLSNIIRQFKARCSIIIKKIYSDFAWQPRFYDRIIRNEKELYKIRKYNSENPLRWEIEKDLPENLEL